ncbi:MAG TPA: RNA polymerase sigma factor [Burkholderiales bacterium]|nr:RNA polymerase sigma factor [Burkholderiales bacterium]
MDGADEELMLAYRDGDARAFEALYGRHRVRLYRFVLRSVKERGLAEELYQDVWMRVIEARRRYAPKARFTTWLYSIAHNRLVDHWRRKGLSLVDVDSAEVEGNNPDPQRQVQARQDLQRFASALEALPPAQREAFLMHEEAGMSVEEIAGATGMAVEAAKSRLRYAVAKLRKAVDDG